jgi:cell division protein DivIC
MPSAYSATNDKQHNDNKGSRRRKRLLAMIVLCFAAWAGVTFFNQADLVNAKQVKLDSLEQQLEATRSVNEQLKLEITRLNDDEYIEQKARKDFQMVSPGETLYIAPSNQEE